MTGHGWRENTISFSEFCKYNTWTVTVDVNVLNEFDMTRITSEWNEYIQLQTMFKYIGYEARQVDIYLPYDVIQLCVKMIGLNCCVWRVDDPELIQQILTAKCGDKFKCGNAFQVGKLKWKIKLYPNGHNETTKGLCGVWLRLLEMPSSWKSIFCQIHIECLQMQNKMVFTNSYNKPKCTGHYISSFEDLKASCGKELTFVITIRIARITLKEDNKILFQMRANKYKPKTQLQWKIDQEMMEKLKSFDKGKGICS
eukprot:965158_1